MASSFQIETQEQQNWCWAAVAATISNYFFPDRVLRQCIIAGNVLNVNCCQEEEPCSVPKPLEEAPDKVNELLSTSLTYHTLNRPLEFKEICEQIDAGLPVCVRIVWHDDEDHAHFVIIMGYSMSPSEGQWVDIADPLFEDSIVPYEQFCSAYWGVGKWSGTCLMNKP